MDLKALFGDRYVVTFDESWTAETPENRTEFRAKGEEGWYYEIKGRCGTAYPYDTTTIAVNLPTRSARRLMKLVGSDLVRFQHGDDTMSFKADAKYAATIVQFIKPKLRRQLSSEQKKALAIRLAPYRFQSLKVAQANGSSEAKSQEE